MVNPQGHIYVVAGPSGVGKGTLCKMLMANLPNLHLSVSATTRAMRPEEKDGVDYYFYTKAQFQGLIDAGQMLEWAEYNDNFYGTPKHTVDALLAEGKDVLLEIETQGALMVKALFGTAATMIFLMPPSLETLRERLVARNTNTPEDIENRIAIAQQEMTVRDQFDCQVVNDDLQRCYQALVGVIHGVRVTPTP